MRSRSGNRVMILVAAMSLLTSAGVVWGGSTAGAASSTITIGGIGDLTGQASSPQPTQGLQAYAAFVN